jgi:tRNA(Arg) A34 adenosine deaminase TadA
MREEVAKSKGAVPSLEHALPRLLELSGKAFESDQPPFSALLLGHDGRIAAEAISNQGSAGGIDFFSHAESNLLLEASGHGSLVNLREHWIISSCEPCPFCASAITAFDMAGAFFLLSQEWVSELRGFSRYRPGKNSTDTLNLLYPDRGTDFSQIAGAQDTRAQMERLFECYQERQNKGGKYGNSDQ